MTTFCPAYFWANKIKRLTNVKSSNVVFFAKNVVISGAFLTTRVVIPESGDSARCGPVNTRAAGSAEIQDAPDAARILDCFTLVPNDGVEAQ
jgi:hypothetical protein